MCAHTSIQRIICFFQLQIFTTTYIVFGFNRWAGVWGKLTPMKWDVFMNFTQLVCNSQSVWGKITPMKWAVFIKLYPMSKARMSLSKILPQTSKKFTQIYLPYLWHYATLTFTQIYTLCVNSWATFTQFYTLYVNSWATCKSR